MRMAEKILFRFAYGLHNANVLSRWDGKAVSVSSKYDKQGWIEIVDSIKV